MSNHVPVDLHLIIDYFSIPFKIKGNERIIKCVFHNEKTGSLYANKDTYKCFGCEAKGNGITFLAKYLGVDNKEAFKKYCEIAGISHENKDYLPNNSKDYYDKLSIPEKILRCSKVLSSNTDYLNKRGISELKSNSLYLLEKDFKDSIDGKEIKIYKGTYIIPIFNKLNKLQSIQYITQNNQKYFLSAHQLKGGFCKFFIEEAKSEKFFLVEGVWDALSLNMAGYNAICVFNKEGLVNCALDNYEEWQYKGFIFADNDTPGIISGDRAANILNTSVLTSGNKEIKDVNDYLVSFGVKALQKHITSFLAGSYLQAILLLIKQKQCKLYYNKFEDKYVVYILGEVLQHKAKSQIALMIINKLQKTKAIFIQSTDAEKVSMEVGKFVGLNCEHIDDYNYHPKYAYYDTYKEHDVTYLNTYKPSGLHAQKSLAKKAFPKIKEHLIHITGKYEYYEWFVEFLAWKWQHPYVKYPYLPIFHGSQGTGKSTVGVILALLFGINTNKDLSDIDFEDKFNGAFENKLFCVCDEVITAENRIKAHAKIKALTGSTTFALENKQVKKKNNYNNFNSIILISNYEYVYPLEEEDRRAVVFKQNHIPPLSYFEKLFTAIPLEIEGFAQHLSTFDLSKKLKLLKTTGREALREISKSYVEEFIDELSINPMGVIEEVIMLSKITFPTIEGAWIAEHEYNGFYIKREEDTLYLSSNYFCALINKKYQQNSRNNRYLYIMARKNPKFSYEVDSNHMITYNKKTFRVVKIKLTQTLL